MTGGQRFESWKEIAAHFGRDVRTVQRWEKTEGLPVHRHSHQSRSSVFAFEDELNVWWQDRRAVLTSAGTGLSESTAPDGEGTAAGESRPPELPRQPRAPKNLFVPGPRVTWAVAVTAVALAGLVGVAFLGHTSRGSSPPTKMYRAPEHLMGGPAMSTSIELAEALGAMQRHDQAVALWATERLVEAFPDEPDAHVLRGECLLLTGHTLRSSALQGPIEAEVATLRRLDPASPYPDFFTARLEHIWRAQWDEATDLFAPILARADLEPDLRASVLVQRSFLDQRNARGLALLEEAYRLAPNNPLVLQRMAKVLHYLNRDADALQRAEQALALDPCAASHFAMHWGLCGLGRHEEAVAELTVAATLDSSPTYTILRGMELLHIGRGAEARQVAAGIRIPEVPEYAFNLACLWARLAERDSALHELRHAFSLGFRGTKSAAVDPDLEILHGDPEFEALLATQMAWRPDSAAVIVPERSLDTHPSSRP